MNNNIFVIPKQLPNNPNWNKFNLRQNYIEEGMFAFVSWKWINPFAERIGNKKCLEVIAGRGILSYALLQKNIDVIATDDYSWQDNENGQFKKWKEHVTTVEQMDAIKSVEKYGSNIDVLIMSWAWMDDTAYRVIKKLYEINPKAVVVFIGESKYGCTADDSFFDHFQIIEDDDFNSVMKNYERWHSIHDRPMLGRYTEEII